MKTICKKCGKRVPIDAGLPREHHRKDAEFPGLMVLCEGSIPETKCARFWPGLAERRKHPCTGGPTCPGNCKAKTK